MRKLFFSVLLIGLFFLSVPMVFAAEFKDVPKNHTFYNEISYLSDKGIISGYEDGMFHADEPVTRAQASMMIGRTLGLSGHFQKTFFPDVTPYVTGSGYIVEMVQRNILNGFPDGNFHPYKPVTRGQMAIFLDRAFELEPCKCANPFKDTSPNQAAFQSILNVHASKIANGYPDGTYRPNTEVTRGQFSAFLARAIEPAFRGVPTTFAVESISGWKPGDDAAEAEIDHDWVIQFTDVVDEQSLRQHISIESESAQKPPRYDVYQIAPKTVAVGLGFLYDYDETYYLSISEKLTAKNGVPLAEPVKMKFYTNKPDFTVNKTIEQEGIRMEVNFAQSGEKIFTKLKATNISNEDIPYTAFDGCDPGISSQLVAEKDGKSDRVGRKWSSKVLGCTQAVRDLTLKPGQSAEATEVLYLPKEEIEGDLFIKAAFYQGSEYSPSSRKPIIVMIPFEELTPQ